MRGLAVSVDEPGAYASADRRQTTAGSGAGVGASIGAATQAAGVLTDGMLAESAVGWCVPFHELTLHPVSRGSVQNVF